MYKKLFSDTLIYGFGAVLIKSVAIFTLPIYTRIFSPADYGIIEMLTTMGSIISIIMTMGLDSAQSYYFMEAKNKGTYDLKKITTSILQLRLIFGVGVVGIVSALSPFIISFTFKEQVPVLLLIIVSVSMFFFTLLSQSLDIFRLIYKSWHFIALSALQTFGTVLFILFFAWYLDKGIIGYFIGNILGIFIAMIIGWFATSEYRTWEKLESQLWPDFIKFGAPLLPSGIMIWIMLASDRWFVMKMLGSYDTGLYAVGAKLSMIVALGIQVFRRAWWPIAMDMLNKDEGKKFFKNIALWYTLAGSLAAVFLTIISPFLIKFIAAPEYYNSWKLVGILCWSSIIFGFYLISGLGIFKSKKTYLTLYTYGLGAVLNILMNYYFIKKIGLIGAAIATVLSLAISNIACMYFSNKYYKIEWPWKRMLIFISFGFVIILNYTGILKNA